MQQQKKAGNGKIDKTSSTIKNNFDDIIESLQISAYDALHGLLLIRTK
jgi:hypothetical protein